MANQRIKDLTDEPSPALTDRVPLDNAVGGTRSAQLDTIRDLVGLAGTGNGGLQVNGGFSIDQFNGGSAITITGTGSILHDYIIDGWMIGYKGTFVINFQRVSDAPPGFTHSLKMTVTTAQTTPAGTDVATLLQPIEGTRTGCLNWGTANNQSLSIGLWIKAHRPGNYSGAVKNAANNTGYAFNLVVNAADTWEYKTLTIPGTATGTWLTTTSTGLYLHITIMAGSVFTGTANTWGGATDNVTGTINGLAALTDVFQISGVCLIPGTAIPASDRLPAIMRDANEEMLLCQRYWRKTSGAANTEPTLFSYNAAGAASTVHVRHPVPMRITPSIAQSGTFATLNCAAPTITAVDNMTYMALTTATALGAMGFQPNASAILTFDARTS